MIQTLCPGCGTAFRVTPDQLKAKQGKVRCGRCQHVFNAIDTLLDAVTEPILQPQPEFPVMQEGDAETPVERPEMPAPAVQAEASVPWPELELRLPGKVKSKRRVWPWLLASLLALLVLVLQAMVQFRVELSVLSPELKPALLALCKPLDCELPLPHKSDLIAIESSDLYPDARNKQQLVLAATLKNRAPFAQDYPDLELTLTDNTDKAILRKVLTPADYLSKEVGTSTGFVAQGEIAVNLVLSYDNSESAAATGYRLYLFYP